MPIDAEPPELSAPLPDPVATLATDAAGAEVTGAHGPHGPFHTHCENCGTKLDGPWCHTCGQHDFEFHRSFWHVFLEALETIFHFEGKFFRNTGTLLLRPGQLTADFNSGRRAAQMPPFRLYIFVSFLFFLIIFLGKDTNEAIDLSAEKQPGVNLAHPAAVAGKAWSDAWREVSAGTDPADWQDPAKVRANLEKVRARIAADATAKSAEPGAPTGAAAAAETPPADSAIATPASTGTPKEERLVDRLQKSADSLREEQLRAKGKKPYSLEETLEDVKNDANKSTFARWIASQGQRASDPEQQKKMVESFKHHLGHMMLACLPIFALLTRFLFRKSGLVYLQHLVIALHFHTFIYLWVLCRDLGVYVVGLPDWGPKGLVAFAANLWLTLYPFLMLRRLFANSWPKTILKTGLLAMFYFMTLALAFSLTGFILFALL
ncbi:MAG: DUF3667 domain-containing protein [Lacunisphaera sp.]|nr:DUF3667 domain-containing protein [Lacunisphaera sp.]